jgi:hypothetical protein
VTGPKPKTFDQNYGRVKKSQQHEKRLAKDMKGRTLRQSGAAPESRWAKHKGGHVSEQGDIKTEDFLIEHKSTEKASISLKREWLNKVTEGARRSGRDPAVIITFTQGMKVSEDWVLIPKSTFDRLMNNQETSDE